MSLLTVGTVAFDSIETPRGKVDRVIGGACTYISWAASYFTNDINLVSIVGEDFPESELDELRNRGVNLNGLEIVEGGKSFYWSGRYHDNMNARDTLVTELNVLADFDPKLPEEYKNSKFVMLGNLTPEIQKQVIDQMEQRPKLIMLDTMNFWMDVAWDSLLETIKHVDIITINDEEARQLSGEYSLVKAAEKIQTLGPKYVVIKKGEHGALLFGEGKIFSAPALPLAEVFDPTGAGDTFAGGMMGYLATKDEHNFEDLKRGIIYGSVLASYCVEEFSLNKLKKLDKEMIKDRVNQFIELSRVDI